MDSRRTVARRLEAVDDFSDPTPALEQYRTPAEIAAHILHVAALQGDLAGATVVDLGTGTGMFAVGAALGDPSQVVGVDVDPSALERARENESEVGPTTSIEWVLGDVSTLPLSTSGATVLSNPPFGAQRGNRHADRAFLDAARSIGAVSYTIHNEGSESFVESFAADAGGTVTHAFRATIPLANRFAFHEERRRTIEAEVFRIRWPTG